MIFRVLTLCLALAAGGAASAEECAYRQPPMSAGMRQAEQQRRDKANPFALLFLLRSITEKEATNALAWRWRGEAEAAAGEVSSALESLTRAVALDPCDPTARLGRGDAARKLGRLKLAYSDFSSVIRRDPTDYAALRARGDLLLTVAEFKRALADYDAALAHGPPTVDLLLNRGGIMQEFGRFDDAIADYNRILQRDPRNVEALVARGYVEFFRQDFAAAERDLSAGADLNENALAWTFLARSRLGRADAASLFAQGVQGMPKQRWIRRIAEGFLSGSDERALIHISTEPAQRCYILFYLGEMALAAGARDRARSHFLAAADDCPKDPIRYNGSLREYVGATEELKRMH